MASARQFSEFQAPGRGLAALPRENPIGVGAALVGQALRLPAICPFGNPESFRGRPTKVVLPITNSAQLFLFPKLDLLSEELGIADVFRQKRSNYARVFNFLGDHFIADIP